MTSAPGQAARVPVPPRGRTYSNPGTLGIVLTNSFEGGTNGTNVSAGNSGGASGRPFDQVTTSGAGATFTYSNAHSAHGTLAGESNLPAGVASKAYCSWTTSMGTQKTAWFRLYLYHTANPTVATRIWQADVNGATLCGAVVLNTSGTLSMTNTAGSFVFTTAATVPLGQWYRIEGFLTGSATAGQVELKLYKTQDSGIADESHTSAATQNTFAPPNAYRFGTFSNTTETSTFNLWFDDVGLSNVGYLGPVVVPPPLSVSVRQATRPNLSLQAVTRAGTVTGQLQRGTGNIPGPASGRGPGGGLGAEGAPVRNPAPGPVFQQAVQAARAALPLQPFLKGRVSSGPGIPAVNPGRGPAFRQRATPARAVLPPPSPPAGRTGSDPGGPVLNPLVQVPLPTQAGQPAGIIPSFTRAGVTMATALFVAQQTSGPPILSQGQPAGTLGMILRTGVASASKTSPPVNPSSGPAFRPAAFPARAKVTPPPRGRTASNPGAAVPAPVPSSGPAFRPAAFPARAKVTPPSRGRTASASKTSPPVNPSSGPAFRPAAFPARAKVTPPSRGRITSGPGVPPPAPVPPPARLSRPAQARLPFPLKGRVSSNPGIPAPRLPAGPRFIPRPGPARIRPVPPPRGRVTGSPGTPARNPAPGPVFAAKPWPVRARVPQNAPRGRASGSSGSPVQNIPLASPLISAGTPYLNWETEIPYFQWATGTAGRS